MGRVLKKVIKLGGFMLVLMCTVILMTPNSMKAIGSEGRSGEVRSETEKQLDKYRVKYEYYVEGERYTKTITFCNEVRGAFSVSASNMA